ncbi:short-chain dehydrogenase/reductase family 16C member 6-like [Trichosurus vulpecula]|uniref:short-chain dehydrogenase/reductase family 16C member 6-like n=1 Tax=Trichosurus vulpecula TaxID=9337 RepID=UPI00186B587F|nr:short-chain dehydrogenase/reductase family 16C member 6-like [Trichosurus vulpecula]
METSKEICTFLGKFLYYFVESVISHIIPKPKKKVAGEIVLITGAGSGLGRLLALKFVRLGAIVVLWDINQEGLAETCRLAKEHSSARVHAYTCDCSKRREIYKVAEQVKKEVGDVTILINNAGVVTGKPFLEISDDLVEKSFLVNAFAHIWTYKAFLPAMIAGNHGHLVCISSAAGLVGINGLGDYCASKFAAFGFAESIYLELRKLKKHGVKTTIVCPYFIKTGMFSGCSTKYPALLPLLEPEYISDKIMNAILEEQVYLITPKTAYFAVVLKHMISAKMTLALGDFLGIYNCMDTFQGRVERDKVQTVTKITPITENPNATT